MALLPAFAGGLLGTGHPAGQGASVGRLASAVEELRVWNQRHTDSKQLHHLLATGALLLASVSPLHRGKVVLTCGVNVIKGSTHSAHSPGGRYDCW